MKKYFTTILFPLIVNYATGQNIWANDTSICFDKVYGSELIFYHKKGVVYKQLYEGCLDTTTRNKTRLKELEAEQLINFTIIQGKDLKIQQEKHKNTKKTLFIISENALLIILALVLL